MEVNVWWSAYQSLLLWHLGRVRGLLQERCCGREEQEKLLVTVPFRFFFPPSRPSPWQRREKPYCSPHLCLSHPSLWSACLLAYLNPVSGNKTSREAMNQLQIRRCALCVLQGLIPCLQYVLFWCFCDCAFDCSRNHAEVPFTYVSKRHVHVHCLGGEKK